MNISDKNTYVKPAIEDLGSLAQMTQSGGQVNSDDETNPDNAFPNPGDS